MTGIRRKVIAVCVLFACAASMPISAAERLPWHVREAPIRFEVSLDLVQRAVTEELQRLGGGNPVSRLGGSIADSRSWRAVPDVFLADLPPTASTLAFDPRYKWLVPGRAGTKDGTTQKLLGGEGTWTIEPQYRWFVSSLAGQMRVLIDGVPATSETGGPGWAPTQLRYRIPPGAKELKVVTTPASGNVRQMGFITRPPAMAEAWICLADGMANADVVPIVVAADGTAAGKEVGAWAPPTLEAAPWQVVFDASTGADRYYVYAVPKTATRSGPKWTPEAGVWLSARTLDRYDPKVNDSTGFRSVWKRARPLGIARVDGTLLDWFPFTLDGGVRRSGGAVQSPEMSLVRWNTHINLPGAGVYQLRMRARQAAMLLVDDVPVVVNNVGSGGKPREVVDVELRAGRHKVEIQQWCQGEGFMLSAALAVPGQPWRATLGTVHAWEGQGFDFCDTVAPTIVHRAERRGDGDDPSDKAVVSLDWTADRVGHWPWTAYAERPAEDLVGLHVRAALAPQRDGVTFRFTFDDGTVVEGADVYHLFLSPGIRIVRCVAVAADGRTIAETAARLRVEANRWTLPVHDPRIMRRDREFEEAVPFITARAALFATMPIADVANVHAWAGQSLQIALQRQSGAALAERLDEALARWDAETALFHADLLADHREQQHAVAARVYRHVFQAEPPGAPRRLQAALALAQLLATDFDKAKEAVALLEGVAAERLPVDWRQGWEFARDGVHHPSPRAASPTQLLEAARPSPLAWRKFEMPLNWHLMKGAAWNLDAAAFDATLSPEAERSKAVDIDVTGRERVAIWCEGDWSRVAVLQPMFVLADGSEKSLGSDDVGLFSAAWGRSGPGPITIGQQPRNDGFGALLRHWAGAHVMIPPTARRFRATVALDDDSPARRPAQVRMAATETDRGYWFRKSFTVDAADAGRPLAVTVGSFMMLVPGARYVSEGAVWLDGVYLGMPGEADWNLPAVAVTAGPHEIVVLLQDRHVAPYASAPSPFGDMRILVPGPYNGDDVARRLEAALGKCQLAAGQIEEGLETLERAAPASTAWPLNTRDRGRVAAQLKRARRLVDSGDDGPSHAIDALEELAMRWPRLRIEPEWQTALMEAHVARTEYGRAGREAADLLAQGDLAEPIRRRVLLTSVRIAIAAGDAAAVRRHVEEMEKNWPYAAETLEAAEAVAAAR